MSKGLNKMVVTEKRKITPRPQSMRERAERVETREAKMIAALSPNLNVMVKAVRKAGHRMIRDFGEVANLQVSQKAPGDFVSNADTMAEKILIESLHEDRPDYGFIGEELGITPAQHDSHFTWIIDPIDGTTNFLHAIPIFAISVALRQDDEIIAGVTYNPVTSELYYAEKGKGAFLMTPTGNVRLRVSGRKQLSYALVGSNGFTNRKNRDTLDKVVSKVASIRYNGCTTLSLAAVAAGQLDFYIATQFKLWDLAVGLLLIREAGGYVGSFAGATQLDQIVEQHTLLASNMVLKETVKKMIGV